MKPTYLIYCPWNKPLSGGQIALHKLAYNLALGGENVFTMSQPMFPHRNLASANFETKFPQYTDLVKVWPKLVDGNMFHDNMFEHTVVIYPEIIRGNPLRANHVCRWILYDTDVKGREGTEESWDVDDEFFYFGKWVKTFLQEDRTGKLLTAFDFKLDLVDKLEWIFPEGCKVHSKVTCILHRKRSEIADRLTTANFDDISDSFESVQAFLEIVKQYKRFVTYDDSTYYSVLAALAGCESVILGTTTTPDKFRALNSVLKYGVAYGNTHEEMNWANTTRPLITAHLEYLESLSLSQTKNFCNFWENKLNEKTS